MKKIYGFDYLRGMCAILIMLYHYTTRYFDIYFNKSFELDHIGLWWGCFAVSGFFILSGYLTIHTYDNGVKPLKFMKKRIVRLYPAYISAILITTIFTLVLNKGAFIGVFQTLSNFAIYQSVLGMASVDGAYWTLSVEFTFYIIFCILIAFRLIRRIDIINFIWIVIVIALYSFSNHIPGIINSAAEVFAISSHAHSFIIGMTLARIVKISDYKKNLLDFVNLFVCLGFMFSRYSVHRSFFVIVFIVLMIIFAKKNIYIEFFKPIVFIADISYPLYLVHQNIGYMLIDLFESYIIGLFVAVSISVGIAYVVHYFVEKPIVNIIRTR